MIKIVFDGFGLIVIGLLILGYLIFYIIKGWDSFVYHMFKAKAWAKVYTDYPDMLLDVKYNVKYKKHWWNKYLVYKDPNKKDNISYSHYQASEIVRKIETGEITI